MTVYFGVIATAAFLVQVLRTYIAWREWRLTKDWYQRRYQKEQRKKEMN